MNSTFKSIAAFVLGAGVGAFVTWKLIDKKYRQMADEEIDSVKEVFSKKKAAMQNEVDKAHEYKKLVEQYQTESKQTEEVVVSEVELADDEKIGDFIRVITPDEFGDSVGYDTENLTYYLDKVLAYENDDIVEDYGELIGEDWKGRFGEYENNTVYVRNAILHIDYEIVQDPRKYSVVIGDPSTANVRPNHEFE